MRGALRAAICAGGKWDPASLVGYLGSANRGLYIPRAANVTKDGANLVTQQRDVTPLLRHADHATLGPTWFENPVEQTSNGQPVLRYTSGSQFLDTVVPWAAEARYFLWFANRPVSNLGVYLFDQQGASGLGVQMSSQQFWIESSTQTNTGFSGVNELAGKSGSHSGQPAVTGKTHMGEINFASPNSYFGFDGVVRATGLTTGVTQSTSLRLGARKSGVSGWIGDLLFFLAMNREPTTQEKAYIFPLLFQTYMPGLIASDGDSMVSGSGGTAAEAFPEVMQASRALPYYDMQNFGLGSKKLQDCVTEAAVAIDRLAKPAGVRPFQIATHMGWSNDLLAGRTGAQIAGDVATWAAARTAAGIQPIIITQTPFIAAQEPAFSDALTLVRANGGLVVCDANANPAFANPAVSTLDGLHLTAASKVALAAQLAATVNQFV